MRSLRSPRDGVEFSRERMPRGQRVESGSTPEASGTAEARLLTAALAEAYQQVGALQREALAQQAKQQDARAMQEELAQMVVKRENGWEWQQDAATAETLRDARREVAVLRKQLALARAEAKQTRAEAERLRAELAEALRISEGVLSTEQRDAATAKRFEFMLKSQVQRWPPYLCRHNAIP